jgi:hypothetical protein
VRTLPWSYTLDGVITVEEHRSTRAENTVIAARVAGVADEQIHRELEALGLTAEEAAALMARLDADVAIRQTIAVRKARKALREDPLAECA